MATKKSKKSSSKKSSSSKSSSKKVKSIVKNTKGQKVTTYTDGTKSYSGGSSSSSSKTSTPSTTSSKTIDYTKSASESIDQYNARIAAARGVSAPTPTAPTTSSIDYTKSPNESVEQYNTRIANARSSTPVAPVETPLSTPTDLTTPTTLQDVISAFENTQTQPSEGDTTAQTDQTQTDQTQTDQTGNVVQPEVGVMGPTTQIGGAQSLGGGTQSTVTPLSNPSVVDFLNASGRPSDFSSRKQLAGQLGISGYTGTASQNQQLLGYLRGTPMSPTDQVTQSSAGGIAEQGKITPAPVSNAKSLETARAKFGFPQTKDDFEADPISSIKDITKQILGAMGYDEANSAYKTIADELEQMENDRDDEIRNINDDPWLTEGVRIRQIKKVEEKWADRIDSRVNKLQLLDNVRDDARQQAQFALGTAISVWDTERKIQAAQTEQYYQQAQREFENSLKLYELTQPKSADLPSGVQEYMFAVEQGFGGTYFDFKAQLAAAGRAPSSGSGGLTPIQLLGFTNQVEDNFRANPAVQNYTQLVNFGVPSVIQELSQNPSSVNDTILMRTLAKITDPTTGVREGEYETFESATGAINRVFVLPKSWVGKGRLTDLGRQQMGQLVKTRFNAAQKEYTNQYNYYNRQASQVGATLPPPYQISQQSDIYGPRQEDSTTRVYESVVQGSQDGTQNGGFFSNFLTGLLGR